MLKAYITRDSDGLRITVDEGNTRHVFRNVDYKLKWESGRGLMRPPRSISRFANAARKELHDRGYAGY